MSLLLDALNKADQERKRNEATPGINSNHGNFSDNESRDISKLLIALVVIGFLILLTAIYWLGQRSTGTVSSTAMNSSANTSAASKNSSATNNNPSTSKTMTTVTRTTTNQTASSNQSAAENIPDESVTNLYQNTQVPDSNAAITISTPAEPAQSNSEPNQVPAQIPAASPGVVTLEQFANLPEIHDLPNNIRDKVPTLNYSEHNFNGDDSSVKINGNLYRVNDQIGSGIVIDQILSDGILLHIDEYPFKLRALNTWVNM